MLVPKPQQQGELPTTFQIHPPQKHTTTPRIPLPGLRNQELKQAAWQMKRQGTLKRIIWKITDKPIFRQIMKSQFHPGVEPKSDWNLWVFFESKTTWNFTSHKFAEAKCQRIFLWFVVETKETMILKAWVMVRSRKKTSKIPPPIRACPPPPGFPAIYSRGLIFRSLMTELGHILCPWCQQSNLNCSFDTILHICFHHKFMC